VGGGARLASGAAEPRCEPTREAVLVRREAVSEAVWRVTLHKPEASSRLGLRLAGDERPRVVSLEPGLLA